MDLTKTIAILEQTIVDYVKPRSSMEHSALASLCSSLKDLMICSLIEDIRNGTVKLGGISNIHGDNIVGPG